MAIENEELFVEKYSVLLLSAWRDELALNSILADPKKAAIEAGLPVDSGAIVRVDRTQPENPYSQKDVIRDWTETPGVHVLHVPEQPMVDLSELTEADLDTVAAGVVVVLIIIL
jgi:hypothetical protein